MQALIRRLMGKPQIVWPQPVVHFPGLKRALTQDRIVLPPSLRKPARILARIEVPVPNWLRGRGVAAIFGFTIGYGLLLGGHGSALAGHMTSVLGLKVDRIHIEGERETSRADVMTALDLSNHASMMVFDANLARERLLALPWVVQASVRKTLPDTVAITLEERDAFALWQHGQSVSVIDEEGDSIAPLENPKFASLILLVGDGANVEGPSFLHTLSNFPGVERQTRAAVYVAKRRWNLVLKNGVEIKLPEHNPSTGLARLADAERRFEVFDKDIVSVDLRVQGQMIVRLPEAVMETHREEFDEEVKRLKSQGRGAI